MDSQQEKIRQEILSKLSKTETLNSEDLSKEFNVDHQIIVGIIKSLEIKEIISISKLEKKEISLLENGKNCIEKGSPNIQILKEIKSGPKTKKELKDFFGKEIFSHGFSMAMKSKEITYDKKTDLITLNIPEIPKNDEFQEKLLQMQKENDPEKYDQKLLKDYQKNHKFITIQTLKTFQISKGKNFNDANTKFETDLTTELLIDGKWEKSKFSKYNYNTLGKETNNGALHRLLCVREQIRSIFLEQGFEEMPTNNWVESSFWNFDTLFQPQQHPSRDMHDTFFLSKPARSHCQKIYPDYFERVKDIHEKGGYGSIGWQYKWSCDEAEKNILRTHTTAVSSRMLFLMAEEFKKTGKFTPKKYFSIDRVFRNESLDNTHLAEFHQIEGFICDYNLGLGHLLGTIESYFKKLGLDKLRFKPAYNPYTEPSCEIYALHPNTKKWVEIGNSGVFRPEMLEPMGLPSNISVIAWGFSLERPAMIHYHLNNIRELFGHEVNIKHTQDASIYYFNE